MIYPELLHIRKSALLLTEYSCILVVTASFQPDGSLSSSLRVNETRASVFFIIRLFFSSMKYLEETSSNTAPKHIKLMSITAVHNAKYLNTILFLLFIIQIYSWLSATSNLYPTPHTVLSAHWSDTPSSFSRSLLT